METLTNIIGNEHRAPETDDFVPVLNPATLDPLATMPVTGAADVGRAVAAASEAMRTWGHTTPGERSTALLAIADRVAVLSEEFAELEARDAGKPIKNVREDELPMIMSGRPGALRRQAPLRTGLAAFTASGSSKP